MNKAQVELTPESSRAGEKKGLQLEARRKEKEKETMRKVERMDPGGQGLREEEKMKTEEETRRESWGRC